MLRLCGIKFSRLQQHFSCKPPLRVSMLSVQGPFLFHSVKSTLKTGHVFSTFSVLEEGATAAAASTDRCFSSQSLPPATFQHHMIYPVLQKTRGKVAARRRLDTGQNWQRSTHKSCYARIYDTLRFTTKPCNTQLLSRTSSLSALARFLHFKADAKRCLTLINSHGSSRLLCICSDSGR